MLNRIVIIQDRPTQFDAPLYAQLSKSKIIDLFVFYTVVAQSDCGAIDSETAISPQWDNLKGLKYSSKLERSTFSLWRQIVSLRPELVVISGWYPRSHAFLSLLLRLSGMRIGVRSDNTLQHTDLAGVQGWIKRTVMRYWLSIFHVWHPVGSLASEYVRKLSLVQRPVFYFPYAIDVDYFSDKAANYRLNRESIRLKHGFTINDYVVIGIMKWTEREDPITLIDAVIRASASKPNIKLLLVGDGPLRYEVSARLSKAEGRLIMPGYAKYSQLPLYFAMSDIFVHPARSEPYGVSVQEAMSCGLPVIVSNKVGSAPDFIRPGVNGDIFPAGDVQRLSELLETYANRFDDESIKCAAKRSADKWSYQKTISEFNQCLRRKN